eukprot:1139418-Pelagomonas_calceolata.AAC.1
MAQARLMAQAPLKRQKFKLEPPEFILLMGTFMEAPARDGTLRLLPASPPDIIRGVQKVCLSIK